VALACASLQTRAINLIKILGAAYFICSHCAVIASLIMLGQLGAVSPKFGEQKEFAAIAAAVLGDASPYGNDLFRDRRAVDATLG